MYIHEIYMYPYLYIIFTNLCIHTRVNHTRTPTRRSPFEGSSALNKGSHTIFLGIVWVCVCGYDKRENYFIPQGGAESLSSLARTHNHKTLGGIFIGGAGRMYLISIIY